MPHRLSNLGNTFLCRFERTGDLTNISNAILAYRRAVQLTPDGHADMPSRLSNLGKCVLRRSEHTDDLNDITNAISAHQRAVQLTTDGHADTPSRLNNLGNSFSRRFERTGDFSDIVAAISNYQQSAMHKSGPPLVRLTAARRWASLSVSHNPTDSLRAYDVVLDLLSQIVGMDRTIQQRYSSLVDISRLTATATSAASAQGEIGKALEWLEQGRCFVWSQRNQLRTAVDDLRTHNHLLADRFLHISQALESSDSRQEFTPLAIDSTMSQKIALQDEACTHLMLAQDWVQLLEEIRSIPGFLNFLRPRESANIMKDLPRDGPIILINVHDDGCDALALIPDIDEPLYIPLAHFTLKQASELAVSLRQHLSWHGVRGIWPASDHHIKGDIHRILRELWLCIVKPVLDALGFPEKVSPIQISEGKFVHFLLLLYESQAF